MPQFQPFGTHIAQRYNELASRLKLLMPEQQKMDPQVKSLWVAALRSGNYQQTSGALKNVRGHCCLGVLCDLFAKGSNEPQWNSRTLGNINRDRIGDDSDSGLPGARVQIWSGFDARTSFVIRGKRRTLYTHNDDGVPFSEIADAIEAQL